MTDQRIDIDAEMQNPDLLLITDYLIGELDPAQVAAVQLRLKEDEAFREYVAPILLAWSVPPRHVRNPMPQVELAKHWDDFTRRAGFVHQRRRARKRWLTILSIVVVVLASTFFAIKDPVRSWYVDRRDFHTVAYAPGWISIGDGREVQIEPGTNLRVANKEKDGVVAVRLTGTARFRMFGVDSVAYIPELHFITVTTPSAYAVAGSGEFTVRGSADSTDIEVHHPAKRQYIGFVPIPNNVTLSAIGAYNQFTVRESQRARVLRGRKPQLVK